MVLGYVVRSSLLAALIMAAPLWAKGDMVRVEVTGGPLPSPITITDARIQEFNIWAGPGVNDTTLKDGKGFIIDWQAGIVSHPAGAVEHYQVSFYAGCNSIPDDPRCLAEKPRLVYVVSYDYDSSAQRGFVYLPHIGEAWGQLNCEHIYHGQGIEGHWFRSVDSWEAFIRPIIARALAGNTR